MTMSSGLNVLTSPTRSWPIARRPVSRIAPAKGSPASATSATSRPSRERGTISRVRAASAGASPPATAPPPPRREPPAAPPPAATADGPVEDHRDVTELTGHSVRTAVKTAVDDDGAPDPGPDRQGQGGA